MYDWKKVILKPADTLEEAIKTLDREALKIVMVTDDKGSLVGTITDGDIRRALIRHLGMDAHLIDFMFKHPTTVSVKDSRESVLSLIKSKNLYQVPVLDDHGRIVGLETLQNLLDINKLDNPVFLMAGGFGKRLRPLTDDIPKPLLKVGGKPILETILEQFVQAGYQNFYISTHYKAEMIRNHFGDGSNWGISIQYVNEEKPLGTAGSLGLLPNSIPDLPIVMMNGDLLTKVNFGRLLQFNNECDGVATVCVREYDFQVPYGVIKAEENRVTKIVEKPVHKFFVNAGIYVLNSSIAKSISGNEYLDMPQLLEGLISRGEQVNTFPIHEYWMDIGQMEEYEKAHEIFEEKFEQ